MKKNYFFFLFLASIAALFLLASCKQAKVTEKPLESPPQAAPAPVSPLAAGPHPEAAITIPSVARKNETIMLVYRHTGFGYAEAYGFDTYIFRLLADPAGQISGGIVYQRTIGGETESIRYNVSYAGDEIILTASSADKKSWSATLKQKNNRIDVSGAQKMAAMLDKALVFSSVDGRYRESYSVDPAASELPSEIVKNDSALEKGKWTFPETSKAIYSQTKPDDAQNAEGFQISLWYEDKGDFRFATEGPEPVNEVYASGLSAVLTGDHAFLNAVLLDLMLGESRYLRPIYAFAISRRGSGK